MYETQPSKRLLKIPLLLGTLALASGSALADKGGVPQASLSVACGAVTACNTSDTHWDITKTGEKDVTNNRVTWTITVNKGEVTDRILTFKGSLTVTNNGSAPATIGNIVVNLQRRINNKWASISSDVADAASGDGATTANICATGSSEGFSTFAENGGSGALEFTDASNNSVFALVPQASIARGETLVLNYTAKFDASALGDRPVAGESVRLEAIVSFGNAGSRGGSGASCPNVDISGNGVIGPDEANVRSVPCRTTLTIPALEQHEASVNLTDSSANITTTGTLAVTGFATDIGGGTGSEVLSDSAVRTVEITVDPGSDGGTVTNCANLNGSPLPGCGAPVDLKACDTQEFGVPERVGYCTFSKGGYAGSGLPGQIFSNNYVRVFSSGLTIGDYFPDNGDAAPNGAKWDNSLSALSILPSYLISPALEASGALTADTFMASSTSGGQLARQTAALALNVGFSGTVTNPIALPGGFGDLVYFNSEAPDSLNDYTVGQILEVANQALADGTLPYGYTFDRLNALITNLNGSFDGCRPGNYPVTGTPWSQQNLAPPSGPV